MTGTLDESLIRAATAADAPSIATIYNWYVAETVITFEEEPVPATEMAARIASCQGPWLVLEDHGALLGYAYGKPYHARSAYRFSYESTIYLHHDAVGRGHGLRLYGALLDALTAVPVHRVIGAIALPNAASVALHERLGFVKTGHLSEVGHKLGGWVDVGYWCRELASAEACLG